MGFLVFGAKWNYSSRSLLKTIILYLLGYNSPIFLTRFHLDFIKNYQHQHRFTVCFPAIIWILKINIFPERYYYNDDNRINGKSILLKCEVTLMEKNLTRSFFFQSSNCGGKKIKNLWQYQFWNNFYFKTIYSNLKYIYFKNGFEDRHS